MAALSIGKERRGRSTLTGTILMSSFIYVNSYTPCPLCGRKTDCRHNRDGLHFCLSYHNDDARQPAGWMFVGESKDGTWGLWVREQDRDRRRDGGREATSSRKAKPIDLSRFDADGNLKPKRLAPTFAELMARDGLPVPGGGRLAKMLGLPPAVFDLLPVAWLSNDGYNRECWAWPEHDGAGNRTAWSCRYEDGSKRTHGPRGLIVPTGWRERALSTGAVYCPEGMSDTLALVAIGLAAVGRPNSMAGADQLAELLHGLPADIRIVIVGDNDQKETEEWPGRDGATETARQVAELLSGRPVEVAMPPAGVKDVRAWRAAQDDRNYALDLAERFVGGATLIDPSPITPSLATTRATAGTDGASAAIPSGATCPSFYERVLQWREDDKRIEELTQHYARKAKEEEDEVRCLAPRWEWQCRKDLSASRTCEYRCKGCVGCILFKKRRHKRNIETRIRAASVSDPGISYVAYSVQRWSYDLHGRFFNKRFVRLLSDARTGEQLVIGQSDAQDVPYEVRRDCGEDGIQTLTAEQAIKLAHMTIDQADASVGNGWRGKIAVYGREWKLAEPPSQQSGLWMKGKAMGGDVTARTILDVAEAVGVDAKGRPVQPGLRHRFSRMFYFRHKPGWKQKDVDHFYRQLAANDADFPRLDDDDCDDVLTLAKRKPATSAPPRHPGVFDLADV